MKRFSLILLLLGLHVPPLGAAAGGNEFTQSAVAAFAIDARTRVHDVAELDVRAFNDTLAAATARGEPWTGNFIAIALRFAQSPPQGREQRVVVSTGPGEWEPGLPLRRARVTIEDRGWLDDSVAGERWVIWIVADAGGKGLAVARGLRAWECRRSPESSFYSARPCP